MNLQRRTAVDEIRLEFIHAFNLVVPYVARPLSASNSLLSVIDKNSEIIYFI